MKSFPESNPRPLNGWFEYSKKLQWRHTAPALSSEPTVPDFASIIKKLKDDFTLACYPVARPMSAPDKSYKKWLAPQADKQPDVVATTVTNISTEWCSYVGSADAVTRGFTTIASSDNSLWLISSDDGILSEKHFNADTSSWLLQSSLAVEEDKLSTAVPLEQDYNEWLNPVKEAKNYQTWLTAGTHEKQPSKEDDVSNWLHQGYSWIDHSNMQWLLPRGDYCMFELASGCYLSFITGGSTLCDATLPPGSPSGDDTHSDIFGSTQTLTSFGSSDFEVVDDTDL